MANLTAYPLNFRSEDVDVGVLQAPELIQPEKKPRTDSGDKDVREEEEEEEEEELYFYEQYSYIHRHLPDSKYCDDGDIPDELYAKYRKQVYESDGFDVDDVSMYNLCGAIIPYALENSPENNREIGKVIPYAELAIKHFNDKENANFEFVRVLKANTEGVCGVFYYITFEAKDAADGQTKTFQAKVLQKILNQGSEVEFCRLKTLPTN